MDLKGHYHFCENPDCDLVYFDCVTGVLFKREQLINRVTIKDENPKTPLCYCFKVLKEDALKELSEKGSTDVVAMIQERMKGHGCQCEKLNPREGCYLKDIETWLMKQGIDPKEQNEPSSGCCSSSGTKSGCGCG